VSAANVPLRLGSTAPLADAIREATGEDVGGCLECGKCAGGCSTGVAFDYSARQIVQLVKLGWEDELLRMDALSFCVGCGLCGDRCPAGIDVGAIVEYFRQEAHARGVPLSRAKVALFNDLFLGEIHRKGRTDEVPLLLQYNLITRDYLKDADLGVRLFFRGRLRVLRPLSRVKATARIRTWFSWRPGRQGGRHA
jgi:heterodisulfide reductase subunit C2